MTVAVELVPVYVERFWARVEKAPGDGCWRWTGQPNRSGYGTATIAPRVKDYAHRVSWRIHFGAIPVGRHVLHRCDTPLCIRPDHLFLGDQGDNNRDMCAKGRHGFQRRPEASALTQWVAAHPHRPTRGEHHPHAKLTDEQIIRIREASAAGESQEQIGQRFGVSRATVSRIIRGVAWVHVGTPVKEAG